MIELNKYNLDFNLTLKYVNSILENVNLLSTEVLNSLHFNQGKFFTLLPQDAQIKNLHEFEIGGILPQHPEVEYYHNGQKATYSLIPNTRDELSEIIRNQIISHKYICIFDDVNSLPTDNFKLELENICFKLFPEEVYYILNQQNVEKHLILECLRASNTFWHSLGLLSDARIKINQEKELSPEDIVNICMHTKVFLVGAYDGEGYVFWEKEPTTFGL